MFTWISKLNSIPYLKSTDISNLFPCMTLPAEAHKLLRGNSSPGHCRNREHACSTDHQLHEAASIQTPFVALMNVMGVIIFIKRYCIVVMFVIVLVVALIFIHHRHLT